MTLFCARCGHVIRGESKNYLGESLDSRCHRTVITEDYEAMVAHIPTKIRRYFSLSGVDREEYRAHLREFLADYRSLSY